MKIFLESLDNTVLATWSDASLIEGISITPALLQEHIKKHKDADLLRTIRAIVESNKSSNSRVISIPVIAKDTGDLYTRAKSLTELSEYIVAAIPCIANYLPVIKKLVDEDVPVNTTGVFSVTQALALAKIGVRYISVGVGQLEEIDGNALEVIHDTREIFSSWGYETDILATSLKTVRAVHEVLVQGADIVSVSQELLEKMLEHPLSTSGLEKFLTDWRKLEITQFPE